ncbi:hypothetical protein DFJ77DRAFT_462735 [Powellomyces hirtus]|nr:hypothetical protein DFJ77DRAFT_462735 [Powellomyces hirtus]
MLMSPQTPHSTIAARSSHFQPSASIAPSQLNEQTRSLELAITNFSNVDKAQTFSYGATPFLIGTDRKWGVNVYPFGLKPTSKDYMQRIDIYLHIWARDARETEHAFREWIRENNIRFTLTVTEPEPAALRIISSSEHSWCDMEDAAGWWKVSLKACPKLMDLNNDTLLIRIAFGGAAESPTDSMAVWPSQTEVLPLPAMPVDSANGGGGLPFGLFDNPHISDFTLFASGKPIHAQRCVLEARLPGWAQFISLPHNASQRNNKQRRSISTDTASGSSTSSTSSSAAIHGIPYPIVRAFLYHIYTSTPPAIPPTAKDYAYLYLLAEGFCTPHLIKAAKRMVYACLTIADALPLYLHFGGRSRHLQGLIAFYISQNWNEIKPTEAFARLYTHPTPNGTEMLLRLLQRMHTVHEPASRGYSGHSVASSLSSEDDENEDGEDEEDKDDPTTTTPTKLDPLRQVAFRSLLSNPAVSDVHFCVEGKIITAQKSVLAHLSEYFSAMFNSGFAESSTAASASTPTRIDIPDFSYATVHNLLLYLYTSQLDPPPASVIEMGHLYVIADKYQVASLAREAHTLLATHLTPATTAEFLFGFAATYPPLKELVMTTLVREFQNVKYTPGFERVVAAYQATSEWSSLMQTIVARLVVTGFDDHDDSHQQLKPTLWTAAGSPWATHPDTEENGTGKEGDDDDDNDDEDDDDEDIFKDAPSHPHPDSGSAPPAPITNDDNHHPRPTSAAGGAHSPPGKRHATDDPTVLRPSSSSSLTSAAPPSSSSASPSDATTPGPQSPRRDSRAADA